ncbi:MAG: FkbM family methyltransferase [Methanobrevibacter sp.]|jgi:hypothetical protein|nr:FkbM family methyltransferase [Methanobrevibacter sp.]
MIKTIKSKLMKLFESLFYKLPLNIHPMTYIKRKKVIYYLESRSGEMDESSEILKFIKREHNIFIPYNFVKKYKEEDIEVYDDLEYMGKYVLHKKQKLYFPKEFSASDVKIMYNSLLIEADIGSPHCYETSDFHVQVGDVIADAGAAEGIFTLNIIEKIKKAYLFECEEKWIEALKMTFKPWKDKIVIINKYVSENTSTKSISLDDFVENENIEELNFIKADIEGAEISLVLGANRILSNQKDLQIVLCTYHNQNDAEDLNKLLIEKGFKTEFSKGYMIFIWDEPFNPPYLRKGLIRAKNN